MADKTDSAVNIEVKETRTYAFQHGHFGLKITAAALDRIADLDDPVKRLVKLVKRIKALPDVEEILPGTKESEAPAILFAAAETGRFSLPEKLTK